MKGFIYLITSIVILSSCSNQEKEATNNSSENTPTNKIEVFTDSLIQMHMDSNKLAGAGIYVKQGDEVLIHKGYGKADLVFGVEMPRDASFEIGSVTKQFTAAAILLLQKEGKLSLDDDFTKYVPYNTKQRTINIRHLLNHTSGIPSYTDYPEFGDFSTKSLPRDTLLRLMEAKPFNFEPGTELIYNNTGFFILGLIIEEVSGLSYEEYLQKNIWEPLSMNSTYYCDSRKIVKDKSYGYEYDGSDLLKKAYLDHTWPYAAGSLCSTTEDLAKWMEALHKGNFLSAADYKNLTVPELMPNGDSIRYAMGMYNSTENGKLMIGHGGGINGFLSETRYYPTEDLYIIVLLNTAGPISPNSIARGVEEFLLGKSEQKSLEIDGDISRFNGRYIGPVRGRNIEVIVEAKEDYLLFYEPHEMNDTDTVRMYVGNDTWASGNNLYHFEKDRIALDMVYNHSSLVRK